MPLEPKWERHLLITVGDASVYAKLAIEMGLSCYELVLYIGDERRAIARQRFHEPALQMIGVIQQGLEALRKLER